MSECLGCLLMPVIYFGQATALGGGVLLGGLILDRINPNADIFETLFAMVIGASLLFTVYRWLFTPVMNKLTQRMRS